jgi:hypothetical protein
MAQLPRSRKVGSSLLNVRLDPMPVIPQSVCQGWIRRNRVQRAVSAKDGGGACGRCGAPSISMTGEELLESAAVGLEGSEVPVGSEAPALPGSSRTPRRCQVECGICTQAEFRVTSSTVSCDAVSIFSSVADQISRSPRVVVR